MIAEELVTTARNEFERVLQYVMEANNTQISDMEKGIFRHLIANHVMSMFLKVIKY